MITNIGSLCHLKKKFFKKRFCKKKKHSAARKYNIDMAQSASALFFMHGPEGYWFESGS